MKADKMFEKLGYNKIPQQDKCDFYEIGDDSLAFYHGKIYIRLDRYHDMHTKIITIQELQAINKKIKELGWME